MLALLCYISQLVEIWRLAKEGLPSFQRIVLFRPLIILLFIPFPTSLWFTIVIRFLHQLVHSYPFLQLGDPSASRAAFADPQYLTFALSRSVRISA